MTATSAFGQLDGNIILQDCTIVKQQDGLHINQDQMTRGLFCVGYVAGLNDGFRMMPSLLRSKPFYCPPQQGISNDQLVRVVVKLLREHPEELHASARGTVLVALSRAFPCK